MSAIKEETPKVTKKRGRPKKVKPEVTPPTSTEVSKQEARKAVEEILSQASVGASVGLVSPVSIEGARPGASSYDSLDANQGDYIPGTRIKDIQLIPRRAYDETRDVVRKVGLHDDYHYCWVHESKITSFRINGYRFCQYNGGAGSGLADYGFQGTGIYEKTFDNHVRNGDMFLMWCDVRMHEQLMKEDEDYRHKQETASDAEIHNAGYRAGVRTFKEENGVTLYN